ncbi:hypothetical protein [Streptomyces sp. NPDC002758]
MDQRVGHNLRGEKLQFVEKNTEVPFPQQVAQNLADTRNPAQLVPFHADASDAPVGCGARAP